MSGFETIVVILLIIICILLWIIVKDMSWLGERLKEIRDKI